MLNEALLENKLAELEGMRTWSPRVISKFENLLRNGSDEDVFRINPIQFANSKGIAEAEAIDLFLYATRVGLVQMDWMLVCASCGGVVDCFGDLGDVHAHFICNICAAENRANLDDYIQVTFTVLPAVREIIFHHPERLPISDFYRKFRSSKGILPLPDGTAFIDLITSFMKATAYIQPGETQHFEFDIAPGLLKATDLLNRNGFNLIVAPQSQESPQAISVVLADGKFKTQELPQFSVVFDSGAFKFHLSDSSNIQTGHVILDVTNQGDKQSAFCALHLPADMEQTPLQFEPFLSGKRLLSTQSFRDLFRHQIISTEEGIGVRDLTYLFTDLKGSTDLYERIGDLNAFYLVRQHFEALNKVVRDHEGAIVKTIGDAIMATFVHPANAVNAAIAMIHAIQEFNRQVSTPLILKIGVHQGHSIAVTLNNNIDYFGQIVNIAARIQGLADANEIYLSEAVYTSTANHLATYGATSEDAVLKGIADKVRVYKVKL